MTRTKRWAGRKPSLSDEHLAEAAELRRQYAVVLEQRAKLPSIAELALKWNVSPNTARNYVYGHSIPKQHLVVHDLND
jgi:hypothetical protein